MIPDAPPFRDAIPALTEQPNRPRADGDVVVGAADPRWQRLVTRLPTTVFHSPAWLEVLARTYGFPVRARLLLDEHGEPAAGLAYAEIDDLAGTRLVSLPFSDFCDPIVTDGGQWRRLVDGLLAEHRRIDMRCLDNGLPLDDVRFSVAGRARWHAIDVGADVDEIWQRLDGSARRAIRKARTDGVVVAPAMTESDMRAFFELHLGVRKRKYGLLAQPYAFFANIWEQLIEPGNGALMLAKLDGRVIAGVVFLEWQGTLYYKFNASDESHLSSRPNDRVIWEGIVHAHERGLERIDLGLTEWEQVGLIRYKRKYATQEGTITMLRHLPDGWPATRFERGRGVLAEVARLLVDESVPDPVSERAGDLLYRYFA